MPAVSETLTFLEFQAQYQHRETSYEYWYGEAKPKGRPTWIHGLLQRIVMELLGEAGYVAASDVELRIVAEAHPKPDVIATSSAVDNPYPTKAVDVVVEILSADDPMPHLLEKCQAYQVWGFKFVYVVNPESRQLFRWTVSALELSEQLTSIPAGRIWHDLDEAMHLKKRD
jgi:Uma2 family endonuclease